MSPEDEPEGGDRQLRALQEQQVGESISLGNEFAEIRVRKVATRNGYRLLVESPKTGHWVALCPVELEALTWQQPDTFTAMMGHPFGSLFGSEEESS